LNTTAFRAFRIHNDKSGYRAGIEEMRADDLSQGELLVKVAHSSVNYKDALAGTGRGKILRQFPLNGGIDVAGYVAASTDPAFKEGDQVLCTGCGLSETRDGGFAEYTLADERFCFALPGNYADEQAAPLLCAGFIGYRALRMAGEAPRLGIYGFGAAGHIVAQIAVHQGRRVCAFTRPGDAAAQEFAKRLGCAWSGDSTGPPPEPLDTALIFAPVGALVPQALAAVERGGRVVCAGIHMSDIPSFPYALLWGERSVRSVANLTRRDGDELLEAAPRANVRPTTRRYALADANRALADLRAGAIEGAAVLVP